jgi:hypothetical protein
MATKPKVGMMNWKEEIRLARLALKDQRNLLAQIAKGNLSKEGTWQANLAISLLNSQVDERLESLLNYDGSNGE